MPEPPDSAAAALLSWQHACLAAGWHPTTATEHLPVTRALGRVTATSIRAHWSTPACELAAMDGIAVRAATLDGASPRSPVRLTAGSFEPVDTGDPLPHGYDAVVKREHVTYLDDRTAELTEPVPPGRHIRGVGEDVMAGETLLPVGHRIRPVDAAVVAGAGHASVRVVRRPRIAVLPTGDEIRPIGTTTLAPGEVLDTNSPMLGALAREAGCEPVHLPITPDEPDALATVARAAADEADLLLVIAGSSRGRDDHTASVLAAIGDVAVHGVAMRPGHPVVLGVVSGPTPTPVIGVPGYPISAAHVFETFARPLIETLHGTTVPTPATVRARLACAVSSPPHLDESLLVRLEKRPAVVGALHAVPIGRGAGALSVLMRADGTIRVPAGTGGYEAGANVLVETRSGAPPERDEPETPAHLSTIFPGYGCAPHFTC